MDDNQVELLARLAVHYRMISREQLRFALRHQQQQPAPYSFKEALVDLRLVNRGQLDQLERAAQEYLARKRQKVQAPNKDPGPPPIPSGSRRSLEPERLLIGESPRSAHRPPPPPTPSLQPIGQPSLQPIGQPALQPSAPAPSRHLEWLKRVLHHAEKLGASDVHIHASAPVRVRLLGELTTINPEALRSAEAEATLRACLDPAQLAALEDAGDVDLTFDLTDIARFRVNIYCERQGLCGVFHRVPLSPPRLSDLGLPGSVGKLTHHRNGLLLITGPSGSGKTSTLAALIGLINEERADHVITLEDPIEYQHLSNRCLINQRQLGSHTHSFQNALRSALREDPDVICIGELRDLTSIELAMTAAETGHLVIATMPTMGGIRTLHRLVGAFPKSQQARVRGMLAESLRAVLSQKLLPRADGSKMVLAYELLLINQAAANLIREGRVFQISSILQTGRHQGMQALDDSLMALVQEGALLKEVARRHADNPSTFR